MATSNNTNKIQVSKANININDLGQPNLWVSFPIFESWEAYDEFQADIQAATLAAREDPINQDLDRGYGKNHWKNGIVVFFNEEDIPAIEKIATDIIMSHGVRPTLHAMHDCLKKFVLINTQGYSC